ncbi:MAG: biotin/lipoyl-containing protein, partial [Acidimicrobiales bacterium]
SDVVFTGHAIEVRVVAEDPSAGWLGSTGAIEQFEIASGVRCDTGVRAGSVISPEYDSLIAKVISHRPTRAGAVRSLGRALRNSTIAGLETNLHCLEAILAEGDFVAGRTPTSYFDDHLDVVAAKGPSGSDRVALLLGAVFAAEFSDRTSDQVTGFAPSGWRNLRTRGQRQSWSVGVDRDEIHDVEYTMLDGSTAQVLLGPWPQATNDGSLSSDERRELSVRLIERSTEQQTLEIDGLRYVLRTLAASSASGMIHVSSASGSLSFSRAARFAEHELDRAEGGPVSPLPGTVIAVHVAVGQSVAEGAVLMVVEAMKMEHKIVAARSSKVTEVRFSIGDRVDTGELLVALEIQE